MITEILMPHNLVSYEKIPNTIFSSAADASGAAMEKIANSIKVRQQTGEFVQTDLY